MRIGVAIVTSDFDSERKGLTPLSSTLIILKILNMKKYNWDKKRIEEAEIQSFKLKEKLIQEGIKENKCEICGINSWKGQLLTLQLHHLNGVHSDNRLENLQILCPNCHSVIERILLATQIKRKNTIVKYVEKKFHIGQLIVQSV